MKLTVLQGTAIIGFIVLIVFLIGSLKRVGIDENPSTIAQENETNY